MKAATGELNLTLVTVVAIGALLALFTTVLWPAIKNKITNTNSTITKTTIKSANYVDVAFTDYIETELF